MREGFSLSSVILSYLLVGGGLCTGTLVLGLIEPGNQYVGYGLMAAGSFLGGWVAARASRGSTIIEPAIGAIAVVGTIVALVGATEVGRHLWRVAHAHTTKAVRLVR